tara:strand:- start:1072 stop:1629 length:558 start_codon:yes stop_codon:yes gene_type:complete
MPTNANNYNSRVTDETLEKKFRDSFRSQGGAELVDDLYASGVIVPVIDFSAAAAGTVLSIELQQAIDFSVGQNQVNNTNTDIVTNAGFWRVYGTITASDSAGTKLTGAIRLIDSTPTTKSVYALSTAGIGLDQEITTAFDLIIFVASGNKINVLSGGAPVVVDVAYRQIASVSGDLVNPTGFTSS